MRAPDAPAGRSDPSDAAFASARPRLEAIAYRMLGSVADAEDVVQEAYLRWSAGDRAAVAEPERYLATITTRLAVDLLRRRQRERVTYEGTWLPEPLVEPRDPAELADSLSTAFLLLLERLAPAERAAYLLREVFDYGYDEVAAILERSEPACRQMVKRARDRVAAGRPARFHADRDAQARLAAGFLDATRAGDMDALLAVLAADVELESDHGGKAKAARNTLVGASRVARFLLGIGAKAAGMDVAVDLVPINDGLGVASWLEGHLVSVFRFEVEDGRIRRVWITRNPDKLACAERTLARP